jgi:hypothetical protein
MNITGTFYHLIFLKTSQTAELHFMNLAEKTTAIVGVLIAVIGVLIAVAGFLTNYCQFAAVVGGAVVGVLTAAVVSILTNH